MKTVLKFWLPGALLALGAVTSFAQAPLAADPAKAAHSGPSPVVVELYTSQGCSSCPPADAFLGELARREGVLALSFHVDYWNYMGWKDPFSSPASTARQRAYVSTLGQGYIYTPQMVIDGRAQAVGSNRATVGRIIDGLAGSPKLSVALAPEGRDKIKVRIPAADYAGKAAVWLIAYDDEHATKITRGENQGRSLSYFHVVRAIRRVGTWSGEAVELSVNLAQEGVSDFGNCAIIVQGEGMGPVLGAAAIAMGGSN